MILLFWNGSGGSPPPTGAVKVLPNKCTVSAGAGSVSIQSINIGVKLWMIQIRL